ncbi:MAG: hypothetical protein Q4D61_01675 [Cardiobacteriaceae bacterium]|nr:hypothetical protein [Cardiobacteriaceae bacterium]
MSPPQKPLPLHQEWQHGQRIDTLGQQLQRHAQQAPTCQRLMTIPGIGPAPLPPPPLPPKNSTPNAYKAPVRYRS